MDKKGPPEAGVAGEHDDTPIIEILLTLAKSILSRTLSCDIRTLRLAQAAAANLTNLETLSISSGHHNLSQVLLNSLFNMYYDRKPRLTKLVLKDTSLSFDNPGFGRLLKFPSLEVVDIRQTVIASGAQEMSGYVLARHGPQERFLDQAYIEHRTYIPNMDEETTSLAMLGKRRSRAFAET
ncbi:hypothetical protein KVT40_004932 [Elsinoe batatas]|uniref:Uncharacterized protein n=1 Tax=Elsinoe batatas TaxID=2601811 RepID=A0A8K0PJ78_9PEZI|nr:hypothetical protein KVT40_004932 [Elsinoe batatas]